MSDIAVEVVYLLWAVAWIFMAIFWLAPAMGLAIDLGMYRVQAVVAQIGPTSWFNVTVIPLVSGISGALFGVSISRLSDEGIDAWKGFSASAICMMLGITLVLSLPFLHLLYTKEYDDGWAIPIKVAALQSHPDPHRLRGVLDAIDVQCAKIKESFSSRQLIVGIAASLFTLILFALYWGGLQERGAIARWNSALPLLLFVAFLSPLAIPVVGLRLRQRLARSLLCQLSAKRAEVNALSQGATPPH